MPRRKRSVLLREELHRLVDELPEADLYSAKRFMAYLRNTQSPWLQKLLDAPYDDEPLTDADQEALKEAYADRAAGRVSSLEQVMDELGL